MLPLGRCDSNSFKNFQLIYRLVCHWCRPEDDQPIRVTLHSCEPIGVTLHRYLSREWVGPLHAWNWLQWIGTISQKHPVPVFEEAAVPGVEGVPVHEGLGPLPPVQQRLPPPVILPAGGAHHLQVNFVNNSKNTAICPSIYLSIYLNRNITKNLSIYPSIYLSTNIHLSIHVSIHILLYISYLSILIIIYWVFRKIVFLTIHCNPSLVCIAVRDLQSS